MASQSGAGDIPALMADVSFASKHTFLQRPIPYYSHNTSTKINLAYDYGCNVMFRIFPKSKWQRNHFYLLAGFNQSGYEVEKTLYDIRPNAGGHFSPYSTFSPNKLNYKITVYRPVLGLAHYTFYKYVFIFQKLGLYYNFFDKKDHANADYVERYGSSYPVTDAAYVTPDNPDGWHFVNNYSYTNRNDKDSFKNNLFMYYKFGVGARIKWFAPFVAFEFSEISQNIPVPYFKIQAGVNVSILKWKNPSETH